MVKLLKGWNEKLWYVVPQHLEKMISPGTLLQVPLRTIFYPALVLHCTDVKPDLAGKEIKELSCVYSVPNDPFFQNFIKQIHRLYFLPSHHLHQRLCHFLLSKPLEIESNISEQKCSPVNHSEITLTPIQQEIFNQIAPKILIPKYAPHLLQGVTGSGKTYIYIMLLRATLAAHKTVIFLVPEVGLALTFLRIFKEYIPLEQLFGFHSASNIKEKKELWNALCHGKPIVFVGVHLPIITPVANLGLLIIDEEHESGYQEKKHPRLQTKEIALLRAKKYNIPILLGSATPSINTLFLAEKEAWPHFKLTERFNNAALPKIEKISLLQREKRAFFWITNRLKELIKDRLAKKEQTILFINRRGYSFFAQCRECGVIFQCKNCSVSLTVHHEIDEEKKLTCHYCNFSKPLPNHCLECNAPAKSLYTKGIGTQKLIEVLHTLFPEAKIARADLDTTKKKKLWQQTVTEMYEGKVDILVGTQSITKGYHFPGVTLVGIIWADLHLHIPTFNAAEKTIQQLLQVAGRAGRSTKESLVAVQYMQDAELFNLLNEENYQHFYEQEKKMRQEAEYPPFCRFASLEFSHVDEEILEKESNFALHFLEELNEKQPKKIKILGPTKPLVYKIKNREMRQIFFKADDFTLIYQLLTPLMKLSFSSTVAFCPT